MEPAQRAAIRKCRVRLVSDLMIEHMFDSIESRSLFTPIMLECIKAKESRPEKVRTFLDYLQRRGPDAFDQFIQCLRETEHDYVASYVLEEYLSMKNNTAQNNLNNSRGGTVPMSNNIYLTQETQGASQGEMETQGGQMLNSVMETQGPSQTSSAIMETQGSSLGQLSSSVTVSQGINEVDRREEEMQEDNEGDALMSEQSSVQGNESSVPGSTAQGTCSAPQPSLPIGQFSSQVTSMGPAGYTGNFKEEYKMNTDPRGLLLIINNRDFQGVLTTRDGTDVDCDKLKTLFMSLGFGVDVRHNLRAHEIKETLNILSRHQELSQVDCLAVALLTHGSEDYLYGVDANYFNVNEAFLPFTAEKCPALHHKPKFFIINACRGDAEDRGSLSHRDIDTASTSHDVSNVPPQPLGCNFEGHYETSSITYDVQKMPPEPRSVGSRIPNMKDFLVAFSTIPGHVSWRHLNDGSFFIQGFVKVFQEYAHKTDVLSMLVKVNNEVSKNIKHQGVQIPAPQVMLTKTWYLNPVMRQSI
ncbi:caspase-9-like [Mercenaria mercenaria]|uniref:caspase-9-like n=1 Tax=Mercenaria mercenaria TaxID=6596 RepID=UPI00234F7A1E|nr:caspase-9-like [Mercenaria mercenaria]XP_053378968.1 caspase-9-like [Mercenaria mercenaria]